MEDLPFIPSLRRRGKRGGYKFRNGLKETVTIIELCYRLNFLLKADSDLLQDKLAEIGRFLQGLINSLNDKTNNQKQTTKN